MATQTKHRLGDILISKGLITPIQLNIAMEEQKKRRQQLDPLDFAAQTSVAPLGEILIELGFIDRMQLKRGLGWQSVVRKVTFAMSLCAPLLSISYEAAAAPLVPIVSSTKTNNSLPFTIEAENYSGMSGVYNEPTSDTGGGENTGNINTNDWMDYSNTPITIPKTGTYQITYRVASLNGGGRFALREAGTHTAYDTVAVASTGGWQNWTTITKTVTLPAGVHNFGINALSGGFNVNWFKIEDVAMPEFSQTIQAENYTSMSGVFNEPTADTGGGQNTGNINTNDWMSYSGTKVQIPVTGTYKISYRVASLSGGGSFALRESGTNTLWDTVQVPSTGGWQNWVTVERTVTLTAGSHSFDIKAIAGGFNVNWFKIDAVTNASSTTSSSVTPIASVMPAFSQTIQAENYSTMSGVFNETTTDTGGGQNTGNINTNDWMSYSGTKVQIPATGAYKVSYRVASLNGGGSFTLKESSTDSILDTVPVPSTGGWQNWVTVERTINLTAGSHAFDIKAVTGGFNVNWFKIDSIATAASSSSVKPVSISSSSLAVVAPVLSSSAKPIVASSSIKPVASSSSAKPVASSSISSKPVVVSSSSKAASIASSSVASSSSSTPAQALPLTIQAEDYSSMSGVYNEATTDVGGGQDTGNINPGDWMSYSGTSVQIPVTASYKISYRVASLSAGGTFSLLESTSGKSHDTVTVPVTGGWQNWVTVERTVTLTAGTHTFDIKSLSGGFNVNWFKIETIAAPLSVTIEADKYSSMSGVYNEDTSDVSGGQNTGNIDAGDWLVYAGNAVNVPVTGTYTVSYRVASLKGGGSFSLLEAGNNVPYDTVSVPYTGGWQVWSTITSTVTLKAGIHYFGITAITGGFNLNWFKIQSAAEAATTTSSLANSSKVSVASSSSSQATTTTANSSSTASFSSSSAAGGSTSVVDGVVVSKVAGPVSMNWIAPNARQNGSVLDITEIAGYEIRYKLSGAANFTYISINDAWTNMYNFAWLEGNYVFQIAAFDKDGLYSEFVDVVSR